MSDNDESEDSDDNMWNFDGPQEQAIPESTEEMNLSLPRHFRCASHTLNLVATTDVMKSINSSLSLRSQHLQTISRCEALWKVLRSPKQRECLSSILDQCLKRPVIVRWNSLFLSLEQILSVSEKFPNVYEALEFGQRNCLREVDFKYLREYVLSLRPVADTINKLQGDTYCYYGFLLPSIVTLRRKLTQLLDNELQYCKPIIVGLIESVEKRFSDFFSCEGNGKIAAIAAIIHPSFKMRWIGCLNVDVQNSIRYELLRIAIETADTVRTEQPLSRSSHNFFDFGDESQSFDDLSLTFQTTDADMEVRKYLKEQCTDDLTVLNSYPTLKKIFLKYNTPLPSSGPVERLFSYATMFSLPKYNRLNDEHFELRVLAKCNSSKK